MSNAQPVKKEEIPNIIFDEKREAVLATLSSEDKTAARFLADCCINDMMTQYQGVDFGGRHIVPPVLKRVSDILKEETGTGLTLNDFVAADKKGDRAISLITRDDWNFKSTGTIIIMAAAIKDIVDSKTNGWFTDAQLSQDTVAADGRKSNVAFDILSMQYLQDHGDQATLAFFNPKLWREDQMAELQTLHKDISSANMSAQREKVLSEFFAKVADVPHTEDGFSDLLDLAESANGRILLCDKLTTTLQTVAGAIESDPRFRALQGQALAL